MREPMERRSLCIDAVAASATDHPVTDGNRPPFDAQVQHRIDKVRYCSALAESAGTEDVR